MDAVLAFLLMFYRRSFATRRAVELRKRRRLFEAQRPIEVARRKLRRQRRRITIVIASVSIVIFTLRYR